jgi:outer membrane receptor protein involved in Fe transport
MLALIPVVLALTAAKPDTVVVPMPEVVISATRTSRDATSVPNGMSIVTGAELRRRGTHTLSDAIQDLAGVDTGNGSDNGMRLPNIGLWGLKEFDALLITLDGVPVGGPFNPSLSQIPIEDLDHIEIVKGPQGTLYGTSAFAGMIQAFSRDGELDRGHLSLGGGSFSDFHGGAGFAKTSSNGTSLRLSASGLKMDGWQDRTGSHVGRGAVALSRNVGAGHMGLNVVGYDDKQDWGTPLPYDAGEIVPGFEIDRNYAVDGANLEHKVIGATHQTSYPLKSSLKFENTVSYTHDDQTSLRSFIGEVSNDTVASEGVFLEPTEQSFYEDARVVSHFKASGLHELVGGAAVTWGRTEASGIGFDFEQLLSNYTTPDGKDDVPVGDHRSFDDHRTFLGVYLHDDWTPVERFTLGGGGRYDHVSETLDASGQEVGGPLETAHDSQTQGAWSGDLTALVRLAPPSEEPQKDVANLYASWKSSFKPAAPNLTEAESAEILDPERSHSIEVGFKARALDRQLSFNASIFRMDFENMVVSILGAGGTPALTNAGSERFKGGEVDMALSPRALKHATLTAGYAHHDARFVEFTFVTPDGEFRDVSGKQLELVPRNMFNLKLDYMPAKGLGGFVAARYQGERPFNRRNTFFADAYTEWDAGASFNMGPAMLVVTGRNLGDSRHVVSESDIGDSQFYVAPPRRITAEVTTQF